ncbi:MAG: CPBP family intramembrane glutamic endopeptidase [Myxococcota bacterium]
MLLLASPLEEVLGGAFARFVACLAFNAGLFAVLRTRLPLSFRPFTVLLGGSLGLVVALPAALRGDFALPSVVLSSVVVVDAAWEELLFRGLAFDFAERRYGRWGALTLSSVCFAGAHLLDTAATEPLAFAYLLLAGLALGAVRVASGSLWPTLALHAAHNVLLSGVTNAEVALGSVVLIAMIAIVAMVAVGRRGVRSAPGRSA